jgi:hypothetical protein
VENKDLLNVLCGRAEREGGGFGGSWVLLVKEKLSDKVIEVRLTDVLPKR